MLAKSLSFIKNIALILFHWVLRPLMALGLALVKAVVRAIKRYCRVIEEPKRLSWHSFMPRRFVGFIGLKSYYVALLLAFILLFLSDAPVQQTFASVSSGTMGFFKMITDWGKSEWILIPALIYFFVFCTFVVLVRSKFVKVVLSQLAEILGAVFLSVALSGIVVQFLKQIIGRMRPSASDQVSFVGFNFKPMVFDFDSKFASLPSGHTTTAFSFAILLYFLFPRFKIPLFIFAGLILLSRIVVSAHFPSDVYAGALLGTLFAVLFRHWLANRDILFEWVGDRPEPRAQISLWIWIQASSRRFEKMLLEDPASKDFK